VLRRLAFRGILNLSEIATKQTRTVCSQELMLKRMWRFLSTHFQAKEVVEF